jgi:hypothetical protein
MISGISGARAIDASSACAIVAGGTVECWAADARTSPVAVEGVTDATGLGNNNCAVLSSGRVKCWRKGARLARPLKGITNVRAISAGDSHTCMLEKNGAIECWGDMSAGQLGNGEMPYSAFPVRVIGLS